jgi:class 3 adenylate cyclase/tetratricopeptide (TPR) repeat protein
VDLRRKAALADLLGRFLPQGVADRLEESLPSGSEAAPRVLPTLAERRRVAVLFVDLSGFTALSESVDPERILAVVNRFFAVVGEVAERWGGVIDKFMGDAALVVFGAPRAVEGAPVRAVNAALEIHERLRAEGAELARSEPGVDLRASCSIAAGTVISGVVGFAGRCDFTVLGDAVNVAARLQKACGPDGIVVERAVAQAIDPDSALVDLEPLPPLAAKGKREPLSAVRVRPRPERGRSEFLAEEPGLVGRRSELEALEGALYRVQSGGGGALLLVGEAGVGKSRLIAAAQRRARSRKVPVIELRCAGKGPGALLRDLFESTGDTLALALLDAGEAAGLADRMVEALAKRAGRRGFLVTVDDLSSIDGPSRERLAAALPALGHLGGFLLAAARLPSQLEPDALERSEELRPFERTAILEIGPLPTFDAKRLLAQLRPADAEDHPLLERLAREARCIPHLLLKAAGATNVEADLARVDALPAPGPQALQALALLAAADASLLAEALGAHPEAVAAALAQAAADRLIHEGPTGVEIAESSVRERLLQRLVAPEQRRLHSRLARALQARQSPEALVHFAQGEDGPAAAKALAQLCERQLSLGQPAAALELARRALDRLRAAGDKSEAARLGLLEGRCLLALGHRAEATSSFFSAFAASAAAGERATAAIELGHLLAAGGSTSLSDEVLAAASRRSQSSAEALARLHKERGSLAWERGDLAEARRLWAEASRLAESAGDSALKGRCELNLALLARRERQERAPAEIGALARGEGDVSRAGELLGEADALEAGGDRERALAACGEAIALASARWSTRLEAEARCRMSRLLLAANRAPEGFQEAERCARAYGKLGDARGQAHAFRLLGTAAIQLSQGRAAQLYLRRAVQVLTESGDRRGAAEALVELSKVVEDTSAEFYLSEAQHLYQELGEGERAAAVSAHLGQRRDASFKRPLP